MKKNLKRATVGSSLEIWYSNWETRRSDEKLGDSLENWELAGLYLPILYFRDLGKQNFCLRDP